MISLLSRFIDEETEAQSDEVSCSINERDGEG